MNFRIKSCLGPKKQKRFDSLSKIEHPVILESKVLQQLKLSKNPLVKTNQKDSDDS